VEAKAGATVLGHPRTYFGRVVLPEFAAWAANLVVVAIFLSAYAIPVTFHTVLSVVGGNSLANTTSVTPGGVGVTQAFNVAALGGVTDAHTATAYSIGQQLVATAWHLLMGIALVVWVFGWGGGKALVRQSYGDAKDRAAEQKAARRAARTERRARRRTRRLPRTRRIGRRLQHHPVTDKRGVASSDQDDAGVAAFRDGGLGVVATEGKGGTHVSKDIELGPIDYLIVEWPAGTEPTGEGLEKLVDLTERKLIRVIDLAFVRKDGDGTVSGLAITDLGSDGSGDLVQFDGASSGVLGQHDYDEAGAALEPGTAAAILLYENRWAAPFVAAVRRAGAQVVASGRIPVDELVRALDETEPARV
jgi:hypothetical protein